jgi:nitrite reductase/ring-hydroxylating ferredoxin subunit
MTWATHGREEVLVANVDGVYHAMDNVCPHSGGALADGWIKESIVMCPLHGWEFDVVTGCCTHIKDECLRTFPVVVQDDHIYVELPDT